MDNRIARHNNTITTGRDIFQSYDRQVKDFDFQSVFSKVYFPKCISFLVKVFLKVWLWLFVWKSEQDQFTLRDTECHQMIDGLA